MPSISDIRSASRYKYGIIVGHDGSIIKYTVGDNVDLILYKIAFDKLDKNGYTEDNLKEYVDSANKCDVRIELL